MFLVSQVIVGLFATGLIAFELTVIVTKPRAVKFLEAFVRTPFHHFLEQTIRLIVGAAFVVASPQMLYSSVFNIIGWLIIITSLLLIGLPWRWHHKFALKVIPTVVKLVQFYGIICALFGTWILYSLLAPAL